MPDVFGFLLLIFLAGAVGLFSSLWIGACHRLYQGLPIIAPRQPRTFTQTGLSEIIMMFGVLVLVSALLGLVLMRPQIDQPDQPSSVAANEMAANEMAANEMTVNEMTVNSTAEAETDTQPTIKQSESPESTQSLVIRILINSICTAAAAIITLFWINLRGLDFSSINIIPRWADISIGFAGAVMIIPAVMLLQALLIMVVDYNHPLLDALKDSLSWQTVVLMAVSSTLIAPLVEEFFFRGLVQSWLEKISVFGFDERPAVATHDLTVETPADSPLLRYAIWPNVISSLLFALVHSGQGPAPISLFFLSLGIGYLYRQTGSIWPGVVVHMALNGFSTAITIFNV